MSSVGAASESARAARLPAGRTRARARRRPRSTAGGVAWIVVAAVVLAGVVAISVAALQANLKLDRLGDERARLRNENAALASRLSTAAAAGRVADRARAAGMQIVDPNAITYVTLGTPGR